MQQMEFFFLSDKILYIKKNIARERCCSHVTDYRVNAESEKNKTSKT